MPVEGVALSIRRITAHACERIARRAFELARKRRNLVTSVHKANVFRVTDGLYRDTVRAVAREFPDVKMEEEIVDAMAAKLVRHPERYDVVLATNMYADILSDLASELSGSLGLAGSILAGEKLCTAQAQHGSAPDIAGQDKANPTSLILSAAMLLEWLGEKRQRELLVKAAKAIDAAIDQVLADPAKRTADLGGKLGTRAFGEAVAAAVTS
jgi:3-isopropylmalate dehydrogenase